MEHETMNFWLNCTAAATVKYNTSSVQSFQHSAKTNTDHHSAEHGHNHSTNYIKCVHLCNVKLALRHSAFNVALTVCSNTTSQYSQPL